MSLFNFFNRKKKEETPLTLENLTKGATLEYDLKTWVVKAVYTYEWENGLITREYKMSDGTSYFFLVVNNDGDTMISKPVPLKKVAPNFKQDVLQTQTVPETISYEERIYRLKNENFGRYTRNNEASWSELTAWMYWSDDDHFICLERWSKFEFESHHGHKINPFEIDNLMPGEDT